MDTMFNNTLLDSLFESKKLSNKETVNDISEKKSINYQKRRKKALLFIVIFFLLGILSFGYISSKSISSVSENYTEKEYLQADYILKNYLNKSYAIYNKTGDYRELTFPRNVKVIATKNNIVISSMINNKCWSISNFEKVTQVSIDLSRLKC